MGTGGTGGLGLMAAEALLEVGAKKIVLSSASGEVPQGIGIDTRIEAMEDAGATVTIEKCDMGSETEVKQLLSRVRAKGALQIVVHSTGLMDNKPLSKMDVG